MKLNMNVLKGLPCDLAVRHKKYFFSKSYMFLLATFFGAPKPIWWYYNVSSTGFCVTPDQTALSHLSLVTYVSLTAQKQYFFEILYILVTYILGAPKPIWWYLNVSSTGFCVTPDQTALSH